MSIFLDTADVGEVRKALETGLVDGVTTNPTLIAKSGHVPFDVYDNLKDLGVDDISMEVMGDYDKMLAQAFELHYRYDKCATIKLPMTVDGLKVCNVLSKQDIRTNVTLIFNAAQALLAAKAGATYVSPFVGRIDDQGYAGTEVVRSCADLLRRTSTQVLAAINPDQAACSYAVSMVELTLWTMPPSVFWSMYDHVLTDAGLAIFEQDSNTN